MMTIMLPLSRVEEERLAEAAKVRGVSAEALVSEAVGRLLIEPESDGTMSGNDARPIWQAMLDHAKAVSDQEFARLPTDGASQHDHYLYGHTKRQM